MSQPDPYKQRDPIDDILQAYELPQLHTRHHSMDATTSIEPAYANLHTFVSRWLMRVLERRVADGSQGGVYWCARWWAHPEGLHRIYALWREWEVARAADTMSAWWREHLDPHLRSLTGEHGPFARCSPSRHYPPMLLPSLSLPDAISALLPERPTVIDPHSSQPARDPDRSPP